MEFQHPLTALCEVEYQAQSLFLRQLSTTDKHNLRLVHHAARCLVDSHQALARIQAPPQSLAAVLTRIAHVWPRCAHLDITLLAPLSHSTSQSSLWQAVHDAAVAATSLPAVRACCLVAPKADGTLPLDVTPEGLTALATVLPQLEDLSLTGDGWSPDEPMGQSAYAALARGAPLLVSLTLQGPMYDDEGIGQLQGLKRLVVTKPLSGIPGLVAVVETGKAGLALMFSKDAHQPLLPAHGPYRLPHLQHLALSACHYSKHRLLPDRSTNASTSSTLPIGLRSLDLDGRCGVILPCGLDDKDGLGCVEWVGRAQLDLVAGCLVMKGWADICALPVLVRSLSGVALVRTVHVEYMQCTCGPAELSLLQTFTANHALEVEWAVAEGVEIPALHALLSRAARVEGLWLNDCSPLVWREIHELAVVPELAGRLPLHLYIAFHLSEPSSVRLGEGLRGWPPLNSIILSFPHAGKGTPHHLAAALVEAAQHLHADGWCGLVRKTGEGAHVDATCMEVAAEFARALPLLRVKTVKHEACSWVVVAQSDARLRLAEKGLRKVAHGTMVPVEHMS